MHFSELPVGDNPQALTYDFFPSHCYAVLWYNWNLVAPERIAMTLGASVEQLEKTAALMGLVRDDRNIELFKERGYATIIRNNWHLLNYEQMLTLLDWSPEKMDFTLREDDFLWVKLGFLKPKVEHVAWHEPSVGEANRLREIGGIIKDILAQMPEDEGRFAFLKNYGALSAARGGAVNSNPDGKLRMIYAHSALYGDPFLDVKNDPYPEELLRDYAALGINAIWMQGILNTLVPWLGEDCPLSVHWQERLAGVKRIASRAAKYGIRLFLYLNEPRNIPAAEMAKLGMGGSVDKTTGQTAFCPHAPGMLDMLSKGIERLCREVPELGGFFTITTSENLTHCLSRPSNELSYECEVCKQHGGEPENISLVLNAIKKGMDAAHSKCRLIAWTWAWQPQWDAQVMATIDPSIELMCVSENGLKTDCHGIKSQVNDYSISKVGPGPNARRMWKLGREAGHKTVAKVQFNTSWELSSIPSIPVPYLVAEHIKNIRECGVEDFMLSWTLGGLPSMNLELLEHSIDEIALRDFGDQAESVKKAWKAFSDAFRKMPFDECNQLYYAPQNIGPANLLYMKPTNYKATMVCGIPYDDLETWRTIYPAEILEHGFQEMSTGWKEGLDILDTLKQTPAVAKLRNTAEAAYCLIHSTELQIRFVRLRNLGKMAELPAIAAEEATLAIRLMAAGRKDSSIGFEATNHYLYTENQLMASVINARAIIDAK